MNHRLAGAAAFSMALAIGLGAWNAHGMEQLVNSGMIAEKYLKTFHTAVEYQFINSIGLLVLGLFFNSVNKNVRRASALIFAGMVIFSFSLYLLSFNQILGSGFKILGAITPLGGVCMIAGWFYMGWVLLKGKSA